MAKETGITVVAATTAAAQTIAHLQSQSFDKPWREDDVRALLSGPGAICFLALRHDHAVGYVLARSSGEEAELLSIGVSPAHRRSGLGLGLLHCLQRVLQEAGVAKVFLEVAATNTAATRLYFREDFRKIGTRKLYYKSASGKRTDAWVLRKQLAPVEESAANDQSCADRLICQPPQKAPCST